MKEENTTLITHAFTYIQFDVSHAYIFEHIYRHKSGHTETFKNTSVFKYVPNPPVYLNMYN